MLRGNQIGTERTSGLGKRYFLSEGERTHNLVAQGQVWRTSEVAKSDRFAYFCEAVCEAFMELSPKRTSSRDFSAVVASHSLTRGAINLVQATSHSVERNTQHLRKSHEPYYYLNLQRKSQSTITQGQNQVELKVGQMSLFDGTRSFKVNHPTDQNMALASFQIPQKLVEDVAQDYKVELEALANTRITDHTTLGPLATATAQALTRQMTFLRQVDAQAMFDSLVRMSVAACADLDKATDIERASLKPAVLAAILGHINQNLQDPELSIPAVATHFSISNRYLHKLFRKLDLSFSEYVHEQRLELANSKLRNREFADLTVAAIAFGCGYSDLSTFNRRFKEKYGTTPSDVRIARL